MQPVQSFPVGPLHWVQEASQNWQWPLESTYSPGKQELIYYLNPCICCKALFYWWKQICDDLSLTGWERCEIEQLLCIPLRASEFNFFFLRKLYLRTGVGVSEKWTNRAIYLQPFRANMTSMLYIFLGLGAECMASCWTALEDKCWLQNKLAKTNSPLHLNFPNIWF